MPDLVTGLTVERVRENVAGVRAEIAAACDRAGRDPASVELLAAVKYVALEDLPILREAGITLAGENRAQELARKVAVEGFTWDFIGHLQSRKVRQILPLVRLIHSVGSDSVVAELLKRAPGCGRRPEVLIEVNVAGEEGKSGFAPGQLGAVLEQLRAPGVLDVTGLMTMPPLAADPAESRPWFAKLAALAGEHGLTRLSMGTTQDFAVAVEEGATIVRVGSRLVR